MVFRRQIGYIDASGKMRLFKPLCAPTSMTAAPDGNLWIVNRQANLIRRITPQGTVSSFPTTSGIAGRHCGRTRRQSLGLRHDEVRSDHLIRRTDKTVRYI
jgi:hypothetical protein